jgi:hypothetical protein
MNRTIRITMGNACVALAAALCAAMAGNARAAAATEAAPAQEPQQLDEIWVYGKSLSRRIEDAENRMFRRYNKLNKKHDYDVVCGTISLHPGSMIMKRTCQPGFVADYVSANAGWTSTYGYAGSYSTGGSSCTGGSGMIAQQDMNGEMYWVASGCPFRYSVNSAWANPPLPYIPPPAVTAEQREKYVKNFLKVMITDTRLMEMSAAVAKLHEEMDEVQARYQAQKAEADAQRKIGREAIGPARGPRGL